MPNPTLPNLSELIDTEAPVTAPDANSLVDTEAPISAPDTSTLVDTEAPGTEEPVQDSTTSASYLSSAAQGALKTAAAGADLLDTVAPERVQGRAFNPADQPALDAIYQRMTALQDSVKPRTFWEHIAGHPDYNAVHFGQIEPLLKQAWQLENKPVADTQGSKFRDAAGQAFDYYGADPRSTNFGAQVGRGLGTFTATAPAAMLNLPLAVLQMGGITYEDAYTNKEQELRAKGETDAAKIADEAEKAGSLAAVKSTPELAAYMAGGKLASGVVSRFLPNSSPLIRGLAGTAAGTGGNVVVGGTLRMLHGEHFLPNVEQLTQDTMWGFVHGKGEHFKTRESQAVLNGTHPVATNLAMIATDRFTPPEARTRALSDLDAMQAEARKALGLKAGEFPGRVKAAADDLRAADLPATAKAVETSAEDLLTSLSKTEPVGEEKPTDAKAPTEGTGKPGDDITYSVFDTGGGFPSESELESGKIGENEKPSETTLPAAQYPVYEQPVAGLKLSDEVPNFKSNADDTTGVMEGQQLQGKYERLGTGNIIVWERKDGSREVVTGRHRFDLANRTNEPTIPSQLVREADGWTRQKVARLDAEANIRDGQGEIRDYANYFRHSEGSEQDAQTGGLLSRSKGRAGFALGRYASPDLFALYQAEKIREGQALAIVQAAPGDAQLQREGMRFAGTNPRATAEETRAHVEAAGAAVEAGMVAPAEQGDLFGQDDAVMNAVQKAAAVALELRKQAADDVKVLETAKRKRTQLKLTAKEAERFGIADRGDAAQIEVALNRAKAEVQKWEGWHKSKSTRDEVFAKAGVETPKAGAELFAGRADEPFNLVSETAADREKRIAAEAADEQKRIEEERAAAEAEAEKRQGKFFSYSMSVPSGDMRFIRVIEDALKRAPREEDLAGRQPATIVFKRPGGGTITTLNTREGISDARANLLKSSSDPHLVDMVKHVKGLADRVKGVKVRVVRSEADLPKAFRKALDADTAHEGVVDTDTGEVFIFSDHVPSLERATEVFAHEVIGHYGVEKILPAAEWNGIADSIFRENPGIAEAIASHYAKGKKVADLTAEERATVAREYVARLAEQPQLNPTLWQRILTAVRGALRAMGIRKTWSDAELRDLIRKASEELKAPANERVVDDGGIRASLADGEKRSQVGGIEEIGNVYSVRNLAQSTEAIRGAEFNGEGDVNTSNTARAWDLIEQFTNPETAQSAALRANRATGNDIGAALLQNELLRYAVKSAQSDGGQMIRHLLGGVNLFATGAGNMSAAGAILRARGEFNHPLWDAYSQVYAAADEVTARILAGKGNEAEGVRIVNGIKGALNDLGLTPDDFLTALEGTRSAGGETLPEVIGRLLGMKKGEAALDNPMLTAMVKLASHAYENGLNFKFETFNTPVDKLSLEALKPALANIRAKLEQEGANQLESQWWRLMADRAPDREGPLSQADRALQSQLGGILKETMAKLGLVNVHDIPKLTDPEKVAMVLGKGELRAGKVRRVDEQVKAEIERRHGEELEAAGEDSNARDAVEAKYGALRQAWDEASRTMLDAPVSTSMLSRLLQNEIRGGKVDWNDAIEKGKIPALRKAAVDAVLKRVKDASGSHTAGLDYRPLEAALGKQFDAIAGERQNRYNMNVAYRRAMEALRLTLKPERTAEAIISRFARTQSDTPDLQKAKPGRIQEIIRNEFQGDNPPAPGRREAWTSQLVAKLKAEGVSESTAEKLAGMVWREHQSRAAVREMRAAELATERGSLRPLVEQILSTPVSRQTPGWIADAAHEYLRGAGLSTEQARMAATVFARQMETRLADAREAAARRVIERSEPWQRQMERASEGERKKIASDVDRIIEAVRAGVTDPSRNFSEETARNNGWKGFTPEQHARLSELDTLINTPGTGVHEAVRAQNEILRIVERSKIPRSVGENLASSFHNSLLSGLPTLSVNVFGPWGFYFRDAVLDLAQAVANPSRMPAVIRGLRSTLASYGPEFRWALKNDTYANHFNESLNALSTLDRWLEEGANDLKAGRNIPAAVGKLIFGSTDFVRRALSSLDQAAKASRVAYAEQILASDAMKRAGYSGADVQRLIESVNVVKERAIEEAVARGMSKLDAQIHGMDAAREALRGGLEQELGTRQREEIDKTIKNESDLIVGHDSQHINEGMLSNILPNQFLDAVARFRGDPNPLTRVASTAAFGLVTIPYRMLRYAAGFSPYGLVRYAVHKYRTSHGQRSLWEQSMGTRYQERQRLIEAVAGTALMAGLLSLYKPTRDDRDDDRDANFFHITGAGPDSSDRGYQDAWRKRHKSFAVEGKIAGHEFHIPYGRGAGEAFLFPLSIVGALDDYKLKELRNEGRKTPAELSMPITMATAYLSTMAQRGAFIGLKNAGDLISRTTTSRGPGIASVVASNAANFIPWNRFMQTVGNFFQDTPDRSSVKAAILANTPVVGPLLSEPSLNALGDPIGDESTAGKAWFAGAPVVLKTQQTPTNERIYGLIREKGQAPSTPIRSLVEKRYGAMDDRQWHNFVKTRGQMIKTQILEEYPLLQAYKPDEFNTALNKYAAKAEAEAAVLTGLTKKSER